MQFFNHHTIFTEIMFLFYFIIAQFQENISYKYRGDKIYNRNKIHSRNKIHEVEMESSNTDHEDARVGKCRGTHTEILHNRYSFTSMLLKCPMIPRFSPLRFIQLSVN